eukprot:TRINITY_DN3584_c0_g2_i2.p1 TRINITY_DN3584_c0_g2~~TRINITY_DN3584_c0_g2_i2.p1  ORF type:complete len:931 (+),score=297.10 TRINITY_DN3584_c0_g2_i2:132-2924(+)
MPTEAEVIERIKVFYAPDTAEGIRKDCDKWLQNMRKEHGAWEILNSLLAKYDDPTILGFAATGMKWRVKNEKPSPELAESLRQCVLGHLSRLEGKAGRNVLEQLSMALVYLVQQNPSPELVANMCNSLNSNPAMVGVLILFLDSLGSEAGYILDDLRDGRRAQRADEPAITSDHPLLLSVKPNTNIVMGLLHHVWNLEQSKVSPRSNSLMECFARWMRFGGISTADIASSPIAAGSFDALRHDATGKAAGSVIMELSCLVMDNRSEAGPVCALLSSNMLKIASYLHELSDDVEQADIVTRALFRTCRAFAADMAVATPDALQMIDIAVQACTYPDRSIFLNSLGFWHSLSTSVLKITPQEVQMQKKSALEPTVSKFLPVVLQHTAFPAEAVQWTHGCHDEESFMDFRMNDAYLPIEDMCMIISGAAAVKKIYPIFQGAVTDVSKWREAEAVLFFISSAISVDADLRDQLLPELFGSPEALVPHHWRLKFTYIQIIGASKTWIRRKGGQYLNPLLNFLVSHCLATPELHHEVIRTLCTLCDSCSQGMLPVFGTLEAKLHGQYDSLSPKDSNRLLMALSTLSCQLPSNELQGAVQKLCAPMIQKLQATGDPSVVVVQLDRLIHLFDGVDRAIVDLPKGDPRISELEKCWIEAFAYAWNEKLKSLVGNHAEVMEKLTGLVRSVMLSCSLEFNNYLEDVISTMVKCFEVHPQSCILWMTGTVITVFGKLPAYVSPIMEVLKPLLQKTTNVLASSPDVGQYSDFLQEMLYLCISAVNQFPQQLLESSLAAAVFNISLAALVNTDVKREAAHITLNYFNQITSLTKNNGKENSPAGQFGLVFLRGKEKELLEALMHVVVYRDLDASDKVGDILMNLSAVHGQEVLPALQRALQVLPEEVPPKARQRCLEEISRLTKPDEMYDALERLHRDTPSNWR